jgi:hypothetical protein
VKQAAQQKAGRTAFNPRRLEPSMLVVQRLEMSHRASIAGIVAMAPAAPRSFGDLMGANKQI